MSLTNISRTNISVLLLLLVHIALVTSSPLHLGPFRDLPPALYAQLKNPTHAKISEDLSHVTFETSEHKPEPVVAGSDVKSQLMEEWPEETIVEVEENLKSIVDKIKEEDIIDDLPAAFEEITSHIIENEKEHIQEEHIPEEHIPEEHVIEEDKDTVDLSLLENDTAPVEEIVPIHHEETESVDDHHEELLPIQPEEDVESLDIAYVESAPSDKYIIDETLEQLETINEDEIKSIDNNHDEVIQTDSLNEELDDNKGEMPLDLPEENPEPVAEATNEEVVEPTEVLEEFVENAVAEVVHDVEDAFIATPDNVMNEDTIEEIPEYETLELAALDENVDSTETSNREPRIINDEIFEETGELEVVNPSVPITQDEPPVIDAHIPEIHEEDPVVEKKSHPTHLEVNPEVISEEEQEVPQVEELETGDNHEDSVQIDDTIVLHDSDHPVRHKNKLEIEQGDLVDLEEPFFDNSGNEPSFIPEETITSDDETNLDNGDDLAILPELQEEDEETALLPSNDASLTDSSSTVVPAEGNGVIEENETVEPKSVSNTAEYISSPSTIDSLALQGRLLDPLIKLPPGSAQPVSAPAPNDNLGAGAISGIVISVLLSMVILLGAGGYVYYQRDNLNRPKELKGDRSCANSESGGYIDDQCRVSYVNSQVDIPKEQQPHVAIGMEDLRKNNVFKNTLAE